MTTDFRNRIEKKFKHLSKWAKRKKIQAWRVYDRDIPEYPFIIDIYDKSLVFQVLQKERENDDERFEQLIDQCAQISSEICRIDENRVYFKMRKAQKGKSQYEKLSGREDEIIIEENDCRFYCKLAPYLDTGLFLDHRILRKKLADEASGKRFLNLFSYTGSFSVFCAKGGADFVESVDLSHTYQEWARRNFTLNGLPPHNHSFIESDVFSYLQAARRQNKRFDLILLDPPTFSNSKKMTRILNIQRDAPELISACYDLLLTGGKLYFSTNFQNFKLHPSILEEYRPKELTKITIDEDFRRTTPHQCWEFIRQ